MDYTVQHSFVHEHFLGTLNRYLDRQILSWSTRPLRVVLYGPRRVGKKTMAMTIQKEFEKRRLQNQLLLTSASSVTAWNRGQRPLDAFGAKLEYAVDDPETTANLKSIWQPYTFVYITEAEHLTSQALQLLSQSMRRAKETDEVFGNVSVILSLDFMGSFEVTSLGDAPLYVPGHHQPSFASLQGKCAFLHLDRVVVLERSVPKSSWDDLLARFRAGNLTPDDTQSLLSRVRSIHQAARASVIVTANADLKQEWKELVESGRTMMGREFLATDHYKETNLPISHDHRELVDEAAERSHSYPRRPSLHRRLVLRVGDPVKVIGRNGDVPVGALARVKRLPEVHTDSPDLLLEFASQDPLLPTFIINMKPKTQLYRVVSENLVISRSQYLLELAWAVDYGSIHHHPVNSVLLDFLGTKMFGDNQRSAIYNALVHAGCLENVQILGPLATEDLDMKVNRFITDEELRLRQLSDSKIYDP